MSDEINTIVQKLDFISEESTNKNWQLKKQALADVIRWLIEQEGFHYSESVPITRSSIRRGGRSGACHRVMTRSRVGFIAEAEDTAIAIKYVSRNRRVGLDFISSILSEGHALKQQGGLAQDSQVMVVSTRGFTKEAREYAFKVHPVTIELLDLDGVRSWVSRIENSVENDHEEIIQAIHHLSKKLARLVAENPSSLDHLEWRDLERMMATVFDGLGFEVYLTPGSKDAGRDIVLTCRIRNQARTYFVEIKHWRSRKRVGAPVVRDFINVIATEKSEGGIVLATYGFSRSAFQALAEIEPRKVFLGAKPKIVFLCRCYIKVHDGIWRSPEILDDLLISDTI